MELEDATELEERTTELLEASTELDERATELEERAAELEERTEELEEVGSAIAIPVQRTSSHAANSSESVDTDFDSHLFFSLER